MTSATMASMLDPAARHGSEADGAARVHGLLPDGRSALAEARQHRFGPGLDVVRIAAFEQREERRRRRSGPAMSFGPEMRLERRGVFRHQLFAGAHADVLLELGELVGPHQRHEAHAAGGRRGDAHADRVEQRPPQQQAGGRIALHGVGQVGS